MPFSTFRPGDYNPVPGNGILDLKAVYNLVFAANSGESTYGVAIDDVAVYGDGSSTLSTSSPAEVETVSEIDFNAIPLLPAPEPVPPVAPPGMELVWSDEFNGNEINRDNWRFDQGGWGWGNGESQFYTDRPQNARVVDGMLVIEAWEEEYLGSYYTSARLLSQGLQEFQYGRIEARLNVPAGKGTWPAFWMLGTGFEHFAEDPARRWPNVGEIDIMEYVGREPDLVLGTIHGPGYGALVENHVGLDRISTSLMIGTPMPSNGTRLASPGSSMVRSSPPLVRRTLSAVNGCLTGRSLCC